MMIYSHFPRPELARQYADAMLGKVMFSDAPNGLFLAGPRRTGKSTFLQYDLKPELERRGVLVLYVDLWANKESDPAELIATAIGKALEAHRGLLRKAIKASGLESVTLAGIKLDTRGIGQKDGATLFDALKLLQKAADKPIAFFIDEAQHALTTEAGEVSMMALKSARDQLNGPDKEGLMLAMTGSDRDKLTRLVNNRTAAFFGSLVQDLPCLDADFIAFVAKSIEAHNPNLPPVDTAKLVEAFRLFGERPQFFIERLGVALNPLSTYEGRFEDRLMAFAEQQQTDDEAQMESDYLGLPPLTRAVLWRILDKGAWFRPYDAAALAFYQEATGKKTSAPIVRHSLEALRNRSPSLVWKSARGEYAVEDLAMHGWYRKRCAAGTWPPTGH